MGRVSLLASRFPQARWCSAVPWARRFAGFVAHVSLLRRCWPVELFPLSAPFSAAAPSCLKRALCKALQPLICGGQLPKMALRLQQGLGQWGVKAGCHGGEGQITQMHQGLGLHLPLVLRCGMADVFWRYLHRVTSMEILAQSHQHGVTSIELLAQSQVQRAKRIEPSAQSQAQRARRSQVHRAKCTEPSAKSEVHRARCIEPSA